MKKMIMSIMVFYAVFIIGDILWNGLQAEKARNQVMIDKMLDKYRKEGAKDFDPFRAEKLWAEDVRGRKRTCVDCHGSDLTQAGKHSRTGKFIAAMAAWVEPKRYTSEKKIEKWFKQNCNGTWGRDCTPQEKADFLTFLRAPLKQDKSKKETE